MGSSERWELLAFIGRVLLVLQTSAHRLIPRNIPLCYMEERVKAFVKHARL